MRGPFTAEELLKSRTTALLDSHVDAIWYYSTWGMKSYYAGGPFEKLYRCPAPQTVLDRNQALLKDSGKDTLEIMIDVSRKHNLEVFWSSRINDVHDAFFPAVRYNIRTQHPEWCLSTEAEGSKYNYPDPRSCWTGWNFALPQIRQLTIDATREVCQTYDIDGIELDFWRHAYFFKESLQGNSVTKEHRAMFTDMIRKIRKMTEEEGLKRGRPILLAARAFETPELSLNGGLDVKTWLKEGLVDILSVAPCTEQTPNYESLIALAHQFETPIYPIVNPFHKTSVNQNDYSQMLGNLPVWRGDALSLFAQQADGIQMFNVFDPNLKQWHELGDPQKMKTLNRTYVWDYTPSQYQGKETFSQFRMLRFKASIQATPKGSEPVPLYVGEDLSQTDKTGKQRELTLRVRAHSPADKTTLQLTVNNHPVKPNAIAPAEGKPLTTWLTFPVTPATFKKGENQITVKRTDGKPAPITIDQIRLFVKYPE